MGGQSCSRSKPPSAGITLELLSGTSLDMTTYNWDREGSVAWNWHSRARGGRRTADGGAQTVVRRVTPCPAQPPPGPDPRPPSTRPSPPLGSRGDCSDRRFQGTRQAGTALAPLSSSSWEVLQGQFRFQPKMEVFLVSITALPTQETEAGHSSTPQTRETLRIPCRAFLKTRAPRTPQTNWQQDLRSGAQERAFIQSCPVTGREGKARSHALVLVCGSDSWVWERSEPAGGGGRGGHCFLSDDPGPARSPGKQTHRALTSTLVTRWPSSAPDSRRRTVLIRSSLRLRVASASRPAPWGPLLPGDCMGVKSMAASSLSTSASFCAWTTFFPAGRVRCRDLFCEQTPRPASQSLPGRGGSERVPLLHVLRW